MASWHEWSRRAVIAIAANPWVARAVSRHGLAAGAARFVAGEGLDDAVRAVRDLNASGLAATLDCLGEAVRSPEVARRAARTYVETLERIAAERLDANVSLKLTQMGLDIDPELCRAQVRAIVRRAAALGNFVRIDMEGSRYTQATLDLFRELRREHDNVGLVLQAYLYRTFEDLLGLHRLAAELQNPVINLRFCKGAYAEPPLLAFNRREQVDANFRRLVRIHLEAGHFAAIATHDERLILDLLALLDERGIGAGRVEFQMLYGVRRDLQRSMVVRGFPVRVYVPFGGEWYAYFVRRLAERPANAAFVLRSLAREWRAAARARRAARVR